MAILIDNIFASVALSHLWVDLLNSLLAILLAYLSVPLGLTNSVIALVSTVYMVCQSLAQPVAGFLTDRIGPRWLIAGGMLWMGVCFGLAAVIPGRAALVPLILASLGSGSVHPAGSSQATLLGRSHQSNRETTTASYFFVSGQLGYFFGPLAGGPLLERFGMLGLLPVVLVSLPVAAFSSLQLRRAIRTPVQKPVAGEKTPFFPRPAVGGWVIAALAGAAVCQSFLASNITTFIPKHLADLGQPASVYGVMAAVFTAGTVIGVLLGGICGDRFGRRGVIAAALTFACIPVYLIGAVGLSPLLYVVVFLSGICNGAANTSIFVTSQRMFPGSSGLAAGLILAFMFSSGSIGTLLCGHLADVSGFPLVFYLTAGMVLLGGLLGLALREPAAEKTQPAVPIVEIS
jgi:FSR family fosmidomycin resistance protein-like MFS transporter